MVRVRVALRFVCYCGKSDDYDHKNDDDYDDDHYVSLNFQIATLQLWFLMFCLLK